MWFGYLLVSPQWGDTNKYPNHKFYEENKNTTRHFLHISLLIKYSVQHQFHFNGNIFWNKYCCYKEGSLYLSTWEENYYVYLCTFFSSLLGRLCSCIAAFPIHIVFDAWMRKFLNGPSQGKMHSNIRNMRRFRSSIRAFALHLYILYYTKILLATVKTLITARMRWLTLAFTVHICPKTRFRIARPK